MISNNKDAEPNYSVETPTATTEDVQTDFSVQYDRRTQATTVTVREGVVKITPSNSSLRSFSLSAGQQVQVAQNRVGPIVNSSGNTTITGTRGPAVGGGTPRNSTNACFATDSGASSTDRNAHYGWAQRQNAATLAGNLNKKAALLFQCPSMNADQLSSGFADISVIVARYVPDANCFGGDRGVVNTNRSDHKRWAAGKGARVLLDNLQRKMAAALKCMDRSQQNSFFADLSVAMASAVSH